jgi:hypothetical protein
MQETKDRSTTILLVGGIIGSVVALVSVLVIFPIPYNGITALAMVGPLVVCLYGYRIRKDTNVRNVRSLK